jgi:protein SOK2
MNRYGQMQTSPGGVKSEMGPPTRAGAENEHAEAKPHDGYGSQHDAEGEHEGEYTHSSASYGARGPPYNQNPNAAAGPVHSDPSHISPEMTHSPHQNGSGRATPRTTTTYNAYNTTPQRPTQLPQSNLNYVMSNDTRGGAPNGADSGYQPTYQPAPQYAAMNGAPVTGKRMREDDSEDPYGRPLSANGDSNLKRQRTDSVSTRPISTPQSLKAGGMRR